MWTREELAALDAAGKTEALHQLLEAVYGTREPVRRIVSEDLTITEQAFRRWLREDSVQTWALLLLREWAIKEPQERAERLAWREVTEGLTAAAETLSETLRSLSATTEALTRLNQLHDDAQGRCASGEPAPGRGSLQ